MNNYIQIEIGGKKRGCKLGLGFLGEVIETEKVEVTELMDKLTKNPWRTIPLIMFHSMAYNLKRKGEEVTFNLGDVADWIEEEKDGFSSEVVSSFLTAFTESVTKDIPKEENIKEGVTDSKKKLTGKEK